MVNVNPDIMVGKPEHIGSFIPLETLKETIEYWGRDYELPIVVEVDKASIGGGFFSPTEDCVAVYHKEHRRDYNSVVLIQQQQGRFTLLSIYLGGKSKNFMNTQMPTNSAFGRYTVKSAKAAYHNEKIYYNLVLDLVAAAIKSIPDEPKYSSKNTSYVQNEPAREEMPKKTTYTPKLSNQSYDTGVKKHPQTVR